MTRSKFDNFSYIVREVFDYTDILDSSTDPRVVDTNFNSYYIQFVISELNGSTLLTVADEITDNNRWQISEVNNPFVFPAVNSNQVGNGIIRAFGVNTEMLGVSQFGQYPVIIFTSDGRWIAEIGSGNVYITRIVPLDGDVIRDNDSSLDLAFGVAYITSEGLKIAQGKEVIQISGNVEGLQDRNFIANTDFLFQMDHASLVELVGYVDLVPFKTYLVGASIGYNKTIDNSEIIVANPSYIYAYVYNLEHKVWTKITDMYTLLIPNYPELYAVRTKRTGLAAAYSYSYDVVNISNEEDGATQFAIVTRAISFGAPDRFKKLRRSFARGFFNSTANKHPAFYMYKSDDLEEWTYVTGNDISTGEFKDIWLTHSRNSARYYIFVITGDLAVSSSTINRLDGIESEFEIKMGGKLR